MIQISQVYLDAIHGRAVPCETVATIADTLDDVNRALAEDYPNAACDYPDPATHIKALIVERDNLAEERTDYKRTIADLRDELAAAKATIAASDRVAATERAYLLDANMALLNTLGAIKVALGVQAIEDARDRAMGELVAMRKELAGKIDATPKVTRHRRK